jgi:hypothetical protein
MIGPRLAAVHTLNERLLDCARCGALIRVCGYVDDLEPPYVCVFDCRLAGSGHKPAAPDGDSSRG